MPFHDPAKPLGQCYDEDMELVILAAELGIDEFWIGEHHTMAYENIAMPELFIAAAMRETKHPYGPGPDVSSTAPPCASHEQTLFP